MPNSQCSEERTDFNDGISASHTTSKQSLKSGLVNTEDKASRRRTFAFWRNLTSNSSSGSTSDIHSPYSVHITLHCGVNLVPRDKCGTSDPFVKFKFGGRTLGKSKVIHKSLNPQWNENFLFHIVGDFEQPLIIKVYDKDRLTNDYMGCARLDLSQLILGEMVTLEVHLFDETGKATEAYLGALRISFILTHRNLIGVANENVSSSAIQSNAGNKTPPSAILSSISKTSSTASGSPQVNDSGRISWQQQSLQSLTRSPFLFHQSHCAVIFVHVIEGTALLSMDDNGLSDPFIKFRLQPNQKYKTKVCKATLQPRWLEYFELKLYSDSEAFLELSVWDHDVAGKNDFMGRARLDLKCLAREKTHIIHQELEDNAGLITLMVTISGATEDTSATDLYFSQRGRQDIIARYGLLKTTEALDDVGWCRVKVLRARDLPRDAEVFCALELVNTRLQTHTVRKSQGYPEWNKAFVFNVSDLHASLEISLVDQRNSASKFERRGVSRTTNDETVCRENTAPLVRGRLLGRLVIPLLKLRNGQHRWYALKDKNLVRRRPGALLLEVDLIFNPIRAAIKTLQPKERRYLKPDVKFKIQTMRRNVDRFVRLVEDVFYFGSFISSLWSWENNIRSSVAFLLYLIIVWNFETYMLPLTFIMLLLATKVYHCLNAYFVEKQRMNSISEELNTQLDYSEDESEDSDIEDKDDSNVGLMDKIRQIQTYLVLVQQHLHSASSTLERIRNTFRWSVPWLSWLALFLMLLATLLLYFLPLRWIFLLWGANKFTKNLLRPNALDNNELADFLSRVPSDVDLMETRDMKPLNQSNDKR